MTDAGVPLDEGDDEVEFVSAPPPKGSGRLGRKPKWAPDLSPCLTRPNEWAKFVIPAGITLANSTFVEMVDSYGNGYRDKYLPQGTIYQEWAFEGRTVEGVRVLYAKWTPRSDLMAARRTGDDPASVAYRAWRGHTKATLESDDGES